MAIQFTENTFEKEVLQSDVPVLVDFWAPWCGPCKIIAPLIDEIAEEYKSKPIKIGKVNVDENQGLSRKYEVMSIPTLIIFKGGKPERTMVGLQDKTALLKALQDYV